MTLINSGIIDGNNIYENWNENEKYKKELEVFRAYFNVLSVFYEAFTGLASTLDFGEEKINCLRNICISVVLAILFKTFEIP